MLAMCEDYAYKFKITFNATKSQLLYFSSINNDISNMLHLIMNDGKVITHVNILVKLYTPSYIRTMSLMLLMIYIDVLTIYLQIILSLNAAPFLICLIG